MTRTFASARSAVVASAIVAITSGGCGADSRPVPEPRPTYEQIPRDLCNRVEFEGIAKRFGLSMAPWYEPDSDYTTYRNSWYERCAFVAEAEDGRYETKSDHERVDAETRTFDPHGPVGVRIYHEVADAKEAYEQDVYGSFEYWAEQESGATTAELAGWWDSGISLVRFVQPPAGVTESDPPPNLTVAHLVRHENLVVQAILNVYPAPTEDVDGALGLLHDLLDALIDEAVAHLTLTE